MSNLSVIIVSYNGLDLIKNCLDSVKEYNDIGDRLEVIVVEQSPSEEIYNYITEEYTWVKCIRNSNQGYGGGNNVGVKNASGDILLFLNPDTVLIESVFADMLTEYEQDKKLGIAGCRLLDGKRNKVQSFFWKDSISNWKGVAWRFLDKWDAFLPGRMYITGADIFVPKHIFVQAGMFDENIFMYSEETDICNRVEKLGYYTKYYKNKKIIHLEGKTTEDNYIKKELAKMKSYLVVAEKNGEKREDILNKAIKAAKHRSWIFYIFNNKERYNLERKLIEKYKQGEV